MVHECLGEMSTQLMPSDMRPVSHKKGDITVGPSRGSLQLGLETLRLAGREATYRVTRYSLWSLGMEEWG